MADGVCIPRIDMSVTSVAEDLRGEIIDAVNGSPNA